MTVLHLSACVRLAAVFAAFVVSASGAAAAEPGLGERGSPDVALDVRKRQIAREDVFMAIDPATSLGAQAWRVQCNGRFASAEEVVRSGAGELPKVADSARRFGRSVGPAGAERASLRIRVEAGDAQIGGSPRCEVGFFRRGSQALPRGKVFWHAFSMWLDDWAQTSDRMAIAQWYHGVPGAQLNPPLVLVVSGKQLWADLRFSTNPAPIKQADQSLVRLFSVNDGSFYRRWLRVVIRARISPSEDGAGFMTVYLDDRQVAHYEGPIGYASAGTAEYAVHGIYPLVKGRMAFDLTQAEREMYLGRSLIVLDEARQYTLQDMLTALE